MDPSLGWYFRTTPDEKQGPLRFAELQQKLATQAIPRTVEVWSEGMPEWQPALRVGGLIPRALAESDQALRFIVPVGRSGFAIAAGYFGLLSLIPFVGLGALLFTGLAVWDLRKHPEKRGWGRVVFGGVMGLAFTVLYGIAFLAH